MVPSRAVAEEAVQDTWLGVVRGIERFEGASSFKTWLYRILVNRARSAGAKERRTETLPEDDDPRSTPCLRPSREQKCRRWHRARQCLRPEASLDSSTNWLTTVGPWRTFVFND